MKFIRILALTNVSEVFGKPLVGGFTDDMMCADTFTRKPNTFVIAKDFPLDSSSDDFESLKKECRKFYMTLDGYSCLTVGDLNGGFCTAYKKAEIQTFGVLMGR